MARRQQRKFISTTLLVGEKLVAQHREQRKNDKVQLPAGSLFEELDQSDDGYAILASLDCDDVVVPDCHLIDLTEIGTYAVKLLGPVSDLRERLAVQKDTRRLAEACEIEVESEVDVDYANLTYPGVVRYVGDIRSRRSGIYFGVELVHHPGHGDSDGSIDGRRYFTCPRNSGCIVDVAAIRRRIVRSHRRDGALPTDSQALSSLPQSGRANGHVEDVRNSSSATISIEPSRPVEPRTATARRAKSFAARLGERTPVQLSDRIVWLDETGVPRFGQVQWIGHIPDLDEDWMVGVTFDDPVGTGTGRYEGEQLFQAPLGHGSLIPVGGLLRADDYSDSLPPSRTDNRVDVVVGRRARKAQANPSAIAGYSRQLSSLGEQQQNNASTPERRNIAEPQTPHNSVICKPKRDCFGRYRGIQGRNNSCYLDATLFSLFQFTSVFDPLLYRPRRGSDIPEYERVQRVLRDEIVRPLREDRFVPHSSVMRLRELLNRTGRVRGMTSEERDPEEFLESLLVQTLKSEPLLHLSTGETSSAMQLIPRQVSRADAPHLTKRVPTVQELFDESIDADGVRLARVPSCLILQLPRSGSSFKMYTHVVPTLRLDITDALQTATDSVSPSPLQQQDLLSLSPSPPIPTGSGDRSSSIDSGFTSSANGAPGSRGGSAGRSSLATVGRASPRRIRLHLFAVLCIETSHYVAYVRSPDGDGGEWYFFDSMADRVGDDASGENVPEVRRLLPTTDLDWWLSTAGIERIQMTLREANADFLPCSLLKRFLQDCYLCMYEQRVEA